MNNGAGDSGFEQDASAEAAGPQAGTYNPPGRSSLSYRVGTYASFLEGMLARVQAQVLQTGSAKGQSPLANLNMGDSPDFAVALLKAWAATGDVLTFYQERIINEGYLRTATESRSVLALLRAIGYEFGPGLAATTYLAFTLRDAKGSPKKVTIPAGAGVMSTPTQGQPGASQTSAQPPQTFETVAAILARVEWNSLQPFIPTTSVSQEVNAGSTIIYLSGVNARLKPAAAVLLVLGAAESSCGQPQLLLRTVKTAEPNQAHGYTRVTLEAPAVEDVSNGAPSTPQFFAFRQQAQLFGFNAARWGDAPDNIRRKYGTLKGGAFISGDGGATWQARNQAMPSGVVRAALVNEGSFFVGVAGGGIYRLTGDSDAWESVSSGLTRRDVHCLARNDYGHLFAGTAGGGVFRSTDNGDSWVMISGGTGAVQLGKQGNLLPANTRLPNTVVRALATYVDDNGVTHIIAGTDNGVYVATDDLSGWRPINKLATASLTFPPNDFFSSSVINTLAVMNLRDEAVLLFAGTDSGVYVMNANAPADGWSANNQNLPGVTAKSDRTTAKILTLLTFIVGDEHFVLAGTSVGVYRTAFHKWDWVAASNGLPFADPQSARVPAPVGTLAHCLVDATTGASVFYAGTSAGLYASYDDGLSWMPVETALFQTLFPLDYDTYSSGLNAEYICEDLRLQFKNNGVALSAESCVTRQDSESWLLEDKRAQRAYALVYDGNVINVYLTNSAASAVATGACGQVLAVTLLDGYVENEWPGFAVNLHRLELDGIQTGILDDSYIALSQPAQAPVDGTPPPSVCPPPTPCDPTHTNGQTVYEVHRIQSSTVVPLNEFGRAATSTVVETDAPNADGSFDRRAMNVLLQSEQLSLLEVQIPLPRPVQGSTIEFAGLIQGLAINQPLAFMGQRASALVVADPGGVFGFRAWGWELFGLPKMDVRVLACDAENRLFAGTKDSGLFVYTDAQGWEPLPFGAADANVCALACDNSRGCVLAATEGGGFFVSGDVGQTWMSVTLPFTYNVTAFAFGVDGAWLCGTDGGGIFRSDDAGRTWTHAQTAPSSLHVSSLVVGLQNDAFAGTKGGGVFRSTDGGGTWLAFNEGLSNRDVRALILDSSGRLFAGTRRGGVFVLADHGETWRAVNNGLSDRDVRTLVFAGGELFAGTRGGGVFISADGGLHWRAVTTGVSNDVRALASDFAGRLFAGARNAALLTSADGARSSELRSELLFTADAQFRAGLDLGLIPEKLESLFAAAGATLTEDASVDIQASDSRWLVFDGAGGVYLVKHEADVLNVYLPSHTLQVAAAPSQSQDATSMVWRLLTDTGFGGLITARPGEISYGPAPAGGTPVSEVGFVRTVALLPDEKRSVVTLAQPLANVYDPNTLAVCANVVLSTHGETVPLEVLGSGDASRPNQSFTLKKPPLTYVPSGSSAALSESTLSVRVSNLVEEGGVRIEAGNFERAAPEEISALWHEVETLYDAGPHDPVYSVRSNENGQVTVVFGDGVSGARLLTGRENVIATYRSGIGTAGNLGAGQLTMLKTKPSGVRGVTNPVPASGGVDPEPMSAARARAPLTVRTLGRIVSLLDYEDFAHTQPGVAKAQAEIVYGGRTRTIYLTVADEDGGPVSATFGSNLLEAIQTYQASAQKVQVGSYEPAYFNLKAQVYYDSRLEEEQVRGAIEALLYETFSFARRDFGQDIDASEIIRLTQGIHGVIAVKLEALYHIGSSEDNATRLSARRAHWNPALKEIRPAQLLLIDARGVKLDMVPIT